MMIVMVISAILVAVGAAFVLEVLRGVKEMNAIGPKMKLRPTKSIIGKQSFGQIQLLRLTIRELRV